LSDSAERRAKRKLIAGAYNSFPSREILQAATEFEKVKAQRQSQSEQSAIQKGSLAVAILSQVPRDDEHNKPLFVDARSLLQGILKKGLANLEEPDDDEEDEEDEDADAATPE
jgi:hypothetical protein